MRAILCVLCFMQMPGVNRGHASVELFLDKSEVKDMIQLEHLDPRAKARICRHEENVKRQTEYSIHINAICDELWSARKQSAVSPRGYRTPDGDRADQHEAIGRAHLAKTNKRRGVG